MTITHGRCSRRARLWGPFPKRFLFGSRFSIFPRVSKAEPPENDDDHENPG